MLLLAATVLASSAPIEDARPARAAVAEARATVRILSGTRIRFDAPEDSDLPRVHQAQIQTVEGPRQAQLIEFE